MGLFTKKESTHFERDEEGKVVEVVREEEKREPLLKRKPMLPDEDKPLTREEQFKPRVHPWNTPRGKMIIKDFKSGLTKVDKQIVRYNRRSNIMNPYATNRRSMSPRPGLGSMPYMTYGIGSRKSGSPVKKRKSSPKYTVVGGKAYPIVKKKKKKSSKKKDVFYDPFKEWRW